MYETIYKLFCNHRTVGIKMRNYIGKYKKFEFIGFLTLFIIVLLLTFLTYTNRDMQNASPLFVFAIQNHTLIMIIMIVISITFGYFWSVFLYKEIESSRKSTKGMLDVVMLFLSDDEKKILDFLVKQDGKTTQAEISRMQGMNKVKSFRAIQRMHDKQLIDIVPHGKVRAITLKEDVLDTLIQKPM